MQTCTDCEKRDTCKKLCPEMEAYISEGERSFSHRWVKPTVMEEILEEGDGFPSILQGKSFRNWVFVLHYLDGMQMNDLTWHLPLEKEQIQKIIDQLYDDINYEENENKRLILTYRIKQGKSVTEISDILGLSNPYIHKIINEYTR